MAVVVERERERGMWEGGGGRRETRWMGEERMYVD